MTIGQLAAAGLGRAAVAHRVRKGWLVRRYRGVYLVGPLRAPHSEAMAVVLAYREGAVLSHTSAATLWGLRSAYDAPLHVTTSGGHSRLGVRAHRASLHPQDVTRHLGIPVSSPARTLLDLATATTPHELDRATEQAQILRLVTDHSVNEQFSRYPRHRGTAALRKAVRPDPKLTRSEAERALLHLIRKARLPEPETNQRIAGHEVGFLWRAQRLVVEVDGYAFHSSRRSFERDRRRDRELHAAGQRVMRVTWRDVDTDEHAIVATLAAALAA